MERIWSGLDARDIFYQLDGWSEFNVGDTPGFNGDVKAALAAIKAKTLLIGVKEDQLFRREELQFAKERDPRCRLSGAFVARRTRSGCRRS